MPEVIVLDDLNFPSGPEHPRVFSFFFTATFYVFQSGLVLWQGTKNSHLHGRKTENLLVLTKFLLSECEVLNTYFTCLQFVTLDMVNIDYPHNASSLSLPTFRAENRTIVQKQEVS